MKLLQLLTLVPIRPISDFASKRGTVKLRTPEKNSSGEDDFVLLVNVKGSDDEGANRGTVRREHEGVRRRGSPLPSAKPERYLARVR